MNQWEINMSDEIILNRLSSYLDSHRDDMVSDLSRLVKIDSTPMEPEEGAPFGRGVAKAYECMMSMGRQAGFELYDADGYGGHMDFAGGAGDGGTSESSEKNNRAEKGGIAISNDERNNFGIISGGSGVTDGIVGILCHLDVVAAGSGWKNEPFSGAVEDGVMYGRGTLDDKGPTVAAFYAMKALKECGVVPKKKIRMILGLDEETDGAGMKYYMKNVETPDVSIVPDSDFPLVNGEKGILVFNLVKKTGKADKGGVSLKRLWGGNAPNMVPDRASAVIVSSGGYDEIRAKASLFSEETGCEVDLKGRGKSLEVTCVGKSAHGAMPWKGKNAVSLLMKFLGQLDFDCSGINDFIRFYNEHIGFELDGGAIGCPFEDEISGKLVWNTGLVLMENGAISVTVNVRCPISFSDDDVYAAMGPVLEKYDIGILKSMYKPPLYYPSDSELVRTLLSIYRKYTGDEESQPLVIGGGTYAREMKNAIAFGALYPGDPDIMHEANECIKIDRLVLTAKIYAETLYRLAVV